MVLFSSRCEPTVIGVFPGALWVSFQGDARVFILTPIIADSFSCKFVFLSCLPDIIFKNGIQFK